MACTPPPGIHISRPWVEMSVTFDANHHATLSGSADVTTNGTELNLHNEGRNVPLCFNIQPSVNPNTTFADDVVLFSDDKNGNKQEVTNSSHHPQFAQSIWRTSDHLQLGFVYSNLKCADGYPHAQSNLGFVIMDGGQQYNSDPIVDNGSYNRPPRACPIAPSRRHHRKVSLNARWPRAFEEPMQLG